MHINTTRALAFAGLLLASTACSHQNRMKPVVAAYETGNYAVATQALTPLLEDRRESEKDRTLYELEAGAVYMAAGDLEKAGASLDAADERMWEYLDDAPEIRVSEQAAAILTNQTIITYYGRTHDRIMCSTYKGLNHLLASDLEKAGVSFRRAQEWQKDAYDKNAAEIEELEKKWAAENERIMREFPSDAVAETTNVRQYDSLPPPDIEEKPVSEPEAKTKPKSAPKPASKAKADPAS